LEKQAKASNTAIIIIVKISKKLLSETLTSSIPIILKRGRIRYGIKRVKFVSCGNENSSSFLILRQLKALMKRTQTLMVIARGKVDKGSDKKPNELNRSPTSITKAILDPIENNTVSTRFDCSILSTLRRTKPGMSNKYRETRTCLIKGILNIIARITIICSRSMYSKNLGFQLAVFMPAHLCKFLFNNDF
jgi:hypothetical protein